MAKIRRELEEIRAFWVNDSPKTGEFVGLRQKRNKINRDYDTKAAFGLRRRGRKRYKLKTEYSP